MISWQQFSDVSYFTLGGGTSPCGCPLSMFLISIFTLYFPETRCCQVNSRGCWGCWQAVQGLAEAAGYALGGGQAQWQVGCALSDQGLWAEAEQPLRQSLALLESQLHPDHPDLACVCNGSPCYLLNHAIFQCCAVYTMC